jgi:type I restriction enzyme S subunit
MTMQETIRPGYKQTEVGVIPEDWSVRSADELCELVVDCKNRTPPVVEGGEYAVVRTPNVRDGRFKFEDLSFTDAASYKIWTERAVPQFGDVLITREAPLGEVCLVPDSMKLCLGQRMMMYRPDTTKVLSEYLLYSLLSKPVQKNLRDKLGGSTVGHAKVDDIRFLKVPVPATHYEQAAIAEALSDADAQIAALEALIAKKRDLKQATMQQLLTGKTRLPGCDGDWRIIQLGRDATLKARIGWQGLTTAEYLESGACMLVTGTEFKGGKIAWSECSYVDWDRYKQDPNIQLQAQDVLVTKDGTIGKVAFVRELPQPATLNSGVFVVRPRNSAFAPSFFYHVMTSRIFGDFLARLSAGSTIVHLYQKDFVDFAFAAPSTLDEQADIAKILSDMDEEITALEAEAEKARLLKQGMMQTLLTGKVRLV